MSKSKHSAVNKTIPNVCHYAVILTAIYKAFCVGHVLSGIYENSGVSSTF